MAGVLTLRFGLNPAAAAAASYQRMLANGVTVSMTGVRQYMALGVMISETAS